MNILKKIIKDILTGRDNTTYDNSRILCLLSFLMYYALAILDTIDGAAWTAMDFASGIGTMAVGFGVNLHLKRQTEPE